MGDIFRMKHEETRRDLGRMTDEEYAELQESRPPHGVKRIICLGRMTEEEYRELWNGNPPE